MRTNGYLRELYPILVFCLDWVCQMLLHSCGHPNLYYLVVSPGSTFASVHDCYWTHASDVDVMNKVCRNQFVNLHSQPILENLSKHFEKTYVTYDAIPTDSDLARAKVLFKNIPEKGELNLDVVKDSVYFFS